MAKRDMRSLFGRFSQPAIALVCAGISALVLLLCVMVGLHFRRAVENEFYRETGNIAGILMASFDDDAATADAILQQLAAQIPPAEVSPGHAADLHRLLAGYALQPSMIGPGILDRQGTLIASALSEGVSGVSLKERKVFRVHAESPGRPALYISAPMKGVITNEWTIQFSRPLRDASGAFNGVVLLSYRLSHFVDLYEKLKLSDGGLAGLTGRDGIVRIRTLNSEIGYGDTVAKIPLVYDRVLAGETSGTFFTSGGPDGLTRIGSFVVSQSTPFYAAVGYNAAYLRAQYSDFFYALGLCWLLLTAAVVGAAAVIHRIGKLSRQMEIDVINSAVAERQKLSADMHDSIGASLAALLAYFTTGNVDLADVRRRIGEVLMELRLLVDSAEADNGDVNLLLGNVRHRMAGSIESAGIALSWAVADLPRIGPLTAQDALAVKLVLMEAMSNVLHHSRAATASLRATFDAKASAIVIALHDDGTGFRPDDAGAGRGLANMRRRIAAISTGATLSIESAPGRGATVRITLAVPLAG